MLWKLYIYLQDKHKHNITQILNKVVKLKLEHYAKANNLLPTLKDNKHIGKTKTTYNGSEEAT